MTTLTRTGNVYTVTQDGKEAVRFDRPIKKAQIVDTVFEFPSIYGYPITLPDSMAGATVIVFEYGEVANEHYWDTQTIPQGV